MRSEIPRVVGVTNVMGAAVRSCSVATEDDLASSCLDDQLTFPKMNVPFNPEGNKGMVVGRKHPTPLYQWSKASMPSSDSPSQLPATPVEVS